MAKTVLNILLVCLYLVANIKIWWHRRQISVKSFRVFMLGDVILFYYFISWILNLQSPLNDWDITLFVSGMTLILPAAIELSPNPTIKKQSEQAFRQYLSFINPSPNRFFTSLILFGFALVVILWLRMYLSGFISLTTK